METCAKCGANTYPENGDYHICFEVSEIENVCLASSALRDILAERARQVAKGYTAEHDDALTLAQWGERFDVHVDRAYPESRESMKRAAAFLLACLESLDRRAAKETPDGR